MTLDKKKPICPQLCQQLCAGIAAGELPPNTRLMSVRDVAVVAGVNPNTVQRAFEQLEQQGVLYSQRGTGWFVAPDTAPAEALHRALIQEKLNDFFADMAGLGLSAENTKEFVKEWLP